MQTPDASPIAAQKDNLFGVCHALGEDFGFNPIYLRVTLAVLLLFSPEAMLISYGTAGLLVLLSRVLVRTPKRAARDAEPRIHTAASQVPVMTSRTVPERLAA